MLKAAFTVLLAAIALIQTGVPGTALPSFMEPLRPIGPPIGQLDFCLRHSTACRPHSTAIRRLELTEQRLAELTDVNVGVNHSVRPRTDRSIYGRLEVWDYAGRYGDCEDYALLKQRQLLELGWPASVLLITVVQRPNGNGHAVLTVLTDEGDLVLDNLTDRVLAWDRTPYRFLMRQSQGSALRWISVGSGAAAAVGATH